MQKRSYPTGSEYWVLKVVKLAVFDDVANWMQTDLQLNHREGGVSNQIEGPRYYPLLEPESLIS